MESDMQLPVGKTCGDCQQFGYCRRLFGCASTNTICDWSPSQFVLRAVEPQPERDTKTIDMFSETR
jgi:hypothetical protein